MPCDRAKRAGFEGPIIALVEDCSLERGIFPPDRMNIGAEVLAGCVGAEHPLSGGRFRLSRHFRRLWVFVPTFVFWSDFAPMKAV